MAPKSSAKVTASYTGTLRNTRSFTRVGEPGYNRHRLKRASTFQSASTSPLETGCGDGEESENEENPSLDVFEASSGGYDPTKPPRPSIDLDDLPIEIISITDNFIASLEAKVNPFPPNIDSLSRRFQEFYAQAADRVRTHINALATCQQRRDVSPAPSNSSIISTASLFRGKVVSLGSKDKPRDEQQMLTTDELADKKRQRKALEAKKDHLEEAVERRLCEDIYDKIYRHRSTHDEAKDAKLRSRTAALDVVGIGPLELGIDLGETSSDVPAEKVQRVRARLEGARKEIQCISQKRYPLAKLHHLKACHKEIVDTLSHFHPSSSADEIMPMLIYTLITLPPEGLNVVSDLNFVQRFRWEPKLVGEAAYCLTNLEAAIAFLETVDLSTLRSDESPAGPDRSISRSISPKTETFPPAYATPGLAISPITQNSQETSLVSATATQSVPPPAGFRAAVEMRKRGLSDLVQTPAHALGAASDTIFTTADQSIKSIGTSLGDSYNFLVGKLGGVPSTVGGDAPVPVPQTLEDARKLIGTLPPEGDDDNGTLGELDTDDRSLPEEAGTRLSVEDRVLALVGGGKGIRDRSVDSVRSASSGSKRVTFLRAQENDGMSSAQPSGSSSSGLAGSVLSLGSSLNPVTRLGVGMNMIRGLGRSTSTPVVPAAAVEADPKQLIAKGVDNGRDIVKTYPEFAHIGPPKEIPKIAPPIQRFMDIEDPGDLKLRETLELLRDYRRLAVALRDLDAFGIK